MNPFVQLVFDMFKHPLPFHFFVSSSILFGQDCAPISPLRRVQAYAAGLGLVLWHDLTLCQILGWDGVGCIQEYQSLCHSLLGYNVNLCDGSRCTSALSVSDSRYIYLFLVSAHTLRSVSSRSEPAYL